MLIAANFFESESELKKLAAKNTPQVTRLPAISEIVKFADLEKIIMPRRTNVAEWSSAETGEGPSMASCNHKNAKNPTDLIPHTKNKKSDINPQEMLQQCGPKNTKKTHNTASPILFTPRDTNPPRCADWRAE